MRGASTLRQSSGKAWRSHVSQALPEGDGHDHYGQCAKAAYRPGRELLQQDALIREHVLGLSCEQREPPWTRLRGRFLQPEWRRVSVQLRHLPSLLIRDQLSQPRHRRNSQEDRSRACQRRSNSNWAMSAEAVRARDIYDIHVCLDQGLIHPSNLSGSSAPSGSTPLSKLWSTTPTGSWRRYSNSRSAGSPCPRRSTPRYT